MTTRAASWRLCQPYVQAAWREGAARRVVMGSGCEVRLETGPPAAGERNDPSTRSFGHDSAAIRLQRPAMKAGL